MPLRMGFRRGHWYFRSVMAVIFMSIPSHVGLRCAAECRSSTRDLTILPLIGRLLEDGDYGTQEYANIKENRPILNIVEVVLRALIDGHVAA